MTGLLSDLRYALRVLGRSPGFVAVAVATITLALAIGVNSAIFSLVNGLILRPIVPKRPAEVVSVFTARKEANRDYRQFSYAEFTALGEARELFSDVTALNFALAGIARDRESMRRAFVFVVSDNFFSFMGAQPAAGQILHAGGSPPECQPPRCRRKPQSLATHGRRPRFRGQHAPGQREAAHDHRRLTCGLLGHQRADRAGNLDPPGPAHANRLGLQRQQPGPRSQQRKELHPERHGAARAGPLSGHRAEPSARRRGTTHGAPAARRDRDARAPAEGALALQHQHDADDDGPLGVISVLLAGMAGIVLLIASLNLANMILARGTARSREIAMRLAIGATRWQIVRQLLVEGVTLALAGGGLGLLLAYWANTLLERSFTTLLGSMNFSLTADLRPDAVVLAVTFGFCLLATLLFSLGPALKSARTDIVSELKNQGAESTATGRLTRFFAPRHLLVMAQMTLALVLIFSAGLFFRGALNAGGLQLGFDPAGVVLTEMDFSLANTPQPEGLRRMQAATDRVRSLPGVQAVGWSTLIPYGNITNSARIMPADAPPAPKAGPDDPQQGVSAVSASITPGYLESIGVRFCAAVRFPSSNPRRRTRRACAFWMKAWRATPVSRPRRPRAARAPDAGARRWVAVGDGGGRHRQPPPARCDGRQRARPPDLFPFGAVLRRRHLAERAVREQGHRRGGGRRPVAAQGASAARRRPARPPAAAVRPAARQEHHPVGACASER